MNRNINFNNSGDSTYVEGDNTINYNQNTKDSIDLNELNSQLNKFISQLIHSSDLSDETKIKLMQTAKESQEHITKGNRFKNAFNKLNQELEKISGILQGTSTLGQTVSTILSLLK
ncbi:hypothetical protein IC620_10740 [Hazenella sp. IB182357]|uniref:Uncharacterized protein n=1 Tax=Polycladospora coralii TaxID=2771432 RepID=A0A926NAB9_9BACL|nr:hypothetical protein [Polycladospora coralii]MBD1372832.1 hypothetical protein [Polycladospora coralii]MBS7529470.1 hypothetical protein [Polycladospora coralii]